MKATKGQMEAVQVHDRALAVSAGAGTGKTWTLTERFLHLLEQYPDWAVESIVAVTFTEKAAREMRMRLYERIVERAQEDEKNGLAPESGWQKRRMELERMQVSTVHSLCARILRENAIAAGIDPLFTVLDEQQADQMKDEAVRQALAELAESEEPALELLASVQVSDLRSELGRLLRQRGTVKRLFEALPGIEALQERWRAGIGEALQEMWQEGQRAYPLVTDALLDIPRVPIQEPLDKLAAYVEIAQNGCRKLKSGDLPGALQDWLGIKINVGSGANWGGKEAMESLKSLLRALREASKGVDGSILAGFGTLDEQAAQVLQHWRFIWERLDSVYNRLKDEQQALDFDDLELLTKDLLKNKGDDPRLRAYREGIHHLMVDEFQDTNRIQQEIVYALAHPSDGGRLFVVGDGKQSIYRFRQAEVSVFNETQADIQKCTGHPAVSLDVSFRTQPRLLKALNDLFDHLLRPMGKGYRPYEAIPGALAPSRPEMPSQAQAPAPVEIWILPDADREGEKIQAEDGRIFEAQLIAKRLIALHDEGYQVWDKGQSVYRPFQYKDAVVLFRATTSLPLYEAQFKALGLPYLTVSGRGYYDRPEVRDLISLLAALNNPRDDLNLAAALRSPLFSLSDETLYRLRWHDAAGQRRSEPAPYAEALVEPPPSDQTDSVTAAQQILAELWTLAGRVDTWRLLRRALDLTAYETTLAMIEAPTTGAPMTGGTQTGGTRYSGSGTSGARAEDITGGGGRQRGNVQKLLEFARDQRGVNLSDFLRSLQDLRSREAREGEALGAEPESGAVNLMSIHAAKGLEFPVVCLADLGREKRGGSTTERILHDPEFGIVCKSRNEDGDWGEPASYAWAKWLDGKLEEAEMRRLLYVACTRAADLLVLSGKVGSSNTWMADVLGGWEIQGAEAEQIVEREGYSLRIIQPPYEPSDTALELEGERPTSPGREAVPALALPLDLPLKERHLAVTRLEKTRMEPQDDPDYTLYPAVRRPQMPEGQLRAPHYKIGRLVHRALADWECLALPAPALAERLDAYARREGIFSGTRREHAVGRAMRMLQALKRSPLYAEIQAAVVRQPEIPFVLNTTAGVLHGQIDLLFQAADGDWRLLDWKTDWIELGAMAEHARAEHRLQLAAYAQAVASTLGERPTAAVCFLALEARQYTFTAYELEETWREEIIHEPS